jgi:hypothetical protein
VGLAILGPLRELDEVAYLRFASVYRGFESLADFEDEIAALRSERVIVERVNVELVDAERIDAWRPGAEDQDPAGQDPAGKGLSAARQEQHLSAR